MMRGCVHGKHSSAARAFAYAAVVFLAAGCSPRTEQPAPAPDAATVVPSEKNLAPQPDRRNCTSSTCISIPSSLIKDPPVPQAPKISTGDGCGIGGYAGSGCLAGMDD